jgi:UDP-N-acetylglucosamine 1-carboxyvinyltransferase
VDLSLKNFSKKLLVKPCSGLNGTIEISGMTKNAGLKQMAACVMAEGVGILSNMTSIADLPLMIDLLRSIGVIVDAKNGQVSVDARRVTSSHPDDESVKHFRASTSIIGALLSRTGEAKVAIPGGDKIGDRKLDMHAQGLTQMGADIEITSTHFIAKSNGRLSGASILLDFPSVGATENLLMAAVMAKGVSILDNIAREPEVQDLCRFLNKMGAKIEGIGTSTLKITGVEELSPASNRIIGDRIETGTYLMLVAMVGGEALLEGISIDSLKIVVKKLQEMGVEIEDKSDGIFIRSNKSLKPIDISTLPYPGFATDYMPIAVALLTKANGTSIVSENIFDNRFAFTDELNKMNAGIIIDGRHAVIRGEANLIGAEVKAFDVRAGAALLLAGLRAEGETLISDSYHMQRGYTDIVKKLKAVGVDVSWVD